MKNEELKVILFYKFANIPDPEKFVREHLRHCKKLGIMGRVLVSNEGINGSVLVQLDKLKIIKKT